MPNVNAPLGWAIATAHSPKAAAISSLALSLARGTSNASTKGTSASGTIMNEIMLGSSWPNTTKPQGNPLNATENSAPERTIVRFFPNRRQVSRQIAKGNTTMLNTAIAALVAKETSLPNREATTATSTCQAAG